MKYLEDIFYNIIFIPFFILSILLLLLDRIVYLFNKKGFLDFDNYFKRDDMYRVKTSSKKEVEKIFHLLYDDSNFYMTRKFEKFNYYVNTEVSQLIADHRNA